MKRINSIIAVLLLVIFGWSCSSYEKILKSKDVQYKYRKAIEFYGKQDYVRASTILEQLTPMLRATSKGDTVHFYLAECNYRLADYYTASFQYQNFTKTYANSPFVEEAQFKIGYCYFLSSPRPNLDQNVTMVAISAFKEFIAKYPSSEKVDESKRIIAVMEDKLVEKSFISAKLYYDLGRYKSSIIALNNSLLEYPNTKYREELMFLILKSNYLLADNSILAKQKERFQATLDEYYTFVSEFPESKHRNEAEKIGEETLETLNISKAVN